MMTQYTAEPDLARATARTLLRLGAVAIDTREPFVYASGTRSPIYTDNRLLTYYPDEREQVVAGLCRRIDDSVGADGVDVVAGTATAGIPWAAWVAARLRKPMVYVRAAAKEHGRGRQIEGGTPTGRRVVVVEDLITTGGSSLQTVDALRRTGAVVTHCFAIFSYEFSQAARAYAAAGVTAVTLSTITTLLDVALDERRLTEDDRRVVVAWLEGQGPKVG